MGAPEFVPIQPARRVRVYSSPPRRPDPWLPDRPADLDVGQPSGSMLGNQGPDQGYVYTLVRRFEDKLVLTEGERADDAGAGACAVALKRASLFGRAPVVHDLTVGFSLFGFLRPDAPADLVALRSVAFEGVANPHHYHLLRRIPDAVPEPTLRLPHAAVVERAGTDWRTLVDVDALTPTPH